MRQDNWPYAFGAYINSVHRTPFAYGSHDCGILAAGVVKALTGVDALPNIKYTSRLELMRELKRAFGSPFLDDAVSKLAAQHGWQEVKPTFAHRGDLVVIGTGRHSRLGVVSLHGTHIMTPGDSGMLYEPFDRFGSNLKTYHI
jgi:hypothetical protein